jgi:hypothetical protein
VRERELNERATAVARAEERLRREREAFGRAREVAAARAGEEALNVRKRESEAGEAALRRRAQAMNVGAENPPGEKREANGVRGPQEKPALAALDVLVAAPATGVPAARPGPTRPSASPRYSLLELASLVEERAPEFRERLDEWQAYLFHLREFADTTGALPSSFNGLVADVFADLFERSAGAAGAR